MSKTEAMGILMNTFYGGKTMREKAKTKIHSVIKRDDMIVGYVTESEMLVSPKYRYAYTENAIIDMLENGENIEGVHLEGKHIIIDEANIMIDGTDCIAAINDIKVQYTAKSNDGWSLEYTGYNMFEDTREDVTVELSESLSYKDIVSFERAFWLKEAMIIDMTKCDLSKVTHTNNAFGLCKAQEILLSNFNPTNLMSAKQMFNLCVAGYIDIRSLRLSEHTNCDEMFTGCKALLIRIANDKRIINMLKAEGFVECDTDDFDELIKLRNLLSSDGMYYYIDK